MREKVAVVTGANRGMGLETVRQLAGLGYHVLLTSRDRNKGQAITTSLQGEGLNVDYHQLDVDDPQSIRALAEYIRSRYSKLDVLINNAGILLEALGAADVSLFSAQPDTILQTFRTNTLGPLLLAQALVPLMGNDGCVVNVSSGMGQLSDMNGGYAAYRLSKTALNAVTRILADELSDTRIKVNSVCPGWVRTDMGGPSATQSVAQGVETTIWLATLGADGPSGGFFRDKSLIPW
jgi:NAD(P)-dependent dehydrogenase (short-subunit alcohol dehydrogenase family)